MFFSFSTFGSNTIKNGTGETLKSLFGINLVKYSSKSLTHLGHRGTPTTLVLVLT